MRNELARIEENRKPVHSRSYILRLWRVNGPQAAEWHASLEDPSTKERLGFSSLEQLFAFLMELGEGGDAMPARTG